MIMKFSVVDFGATPASYNWRRRWVRPPMSLSLVEDGISTHVPRPVRRVGHLLFYLYTISSMVPVFTAILCPCVMFPLLDATDVPLLAFFIL